VDAPAANHISATDHPIRFMFGSRFSRSADRMTPIRLDQIQDRGRQPSCIGLILNGHISETVHPMQFVFGSRIKSIGEK